jgi:exopolyphosphatase / guanosine-5'-triphosphate,3'-diphosphate pyrophosphatase
VRCACIDIGSNTTRLLVAELRQGALERVLEEREFTRIGRGRGEAGRIAPEKVAEVAQVVAGQARRAHDAGARVLRAVATAAIRDAPNHGELTAAVRAASGVDVAVLSADDEARLAFAGATATLERRLEGDLAVVDVGGGSSELAVGTLEAGVRWSESVRVGSGAVADAYLHADPPADEELEAARAHVRAAFARVCPPHPRHAVAVGGSAASMRRLAGAVLDHAAFTRAVRVLASSPVAEVARRFDLDPDRVRLLPGGILILQAAAERLGRPLHVGNGGLREGVVLELMARESPHRR